jgi:hypothetical protein
MAVLLWGSHLCTSCISAPLCCQSHCLGHSCNVSTCPLTETLQRTQDYLVSLADVTSVVVSHDSGFLDAVCTDIIHYEKDKKLKHYKVRPILTCITSAAQVTGSRCLNILCVTASRLALRHKAVTHSRNV